MPRQKEITNRALLQAAVEGLEAQRQRVEELIAEIKSRLGTQQPQTRRKAAGTPVKKKRRMSAEARKRISDAQKKRWAKARNGRK